MFISLLDSKVLLHLHLYTSFNQLKKRKKSNQKMELAYFEWKLKNYNLKNKAIVFYRLSKKRIAKTN